MTRKKVNEYTEFDEKLLALVGDGIGTHARLEEKMAIIGKEFCESTKSHISQVVNNRLHSLQADGKLTKLKFPGILNP